MYVFKKKIIGDIISKKNQKHFAANLNVLLNKSIFYSGIRLFSKSDKVEEADYRLNIIIYILIL